MFTALGFDFVEIKLVPDLDSRSSGTDTKSLVDFWRMPVVYIFLINLLQS